MKTLAGIDGGGTRTRLALARDDGTLLGFAEAGSCSFVDHGMERARVELQRLWHEGWRAAGESPRSADALFMGMGSVLSPDDARTNCSLAVDLGFAEPGRVRADNDAWNAHAGGLGGRPGILLISGTGSACLGRNAEGKAWRAGGWGHLLHDAGSAHALGSAALIAATRDADGRGQPTALTKMVRDALALRDMNEIYRKLHYEGVPRADIAALAPSVVAHAEAGDAAASRILEVGAAALVEMVVTVATRLTMDAPELALTGGLITGATTFRRTFLGRLARILPECQCVEPELPPVFGAVILAFQDYHAGAPSDQFMQNLRSTVPSLTAS